MESFVGKVPGQVGVQLLVSSLWFIGIYGGEGVVTFVAVVVGSFLAVDNW